MNGVAALTLVDSRHGPGEDGLVPSRLMTVEQALAILRETPNRLARLTGNATQAQLRTSPEPGEWSATEVLAHLRSCADVWGRAIEVILAENHPTLKAVNPTTWIDSTDYRELEFGPSLNAVTRQRRRPAGRSRTVAVRRLVPERHRDRNRKASRPHRALLRRPVSPARAGALEAG